MLVVLALVGVGFAMTENILYFGRAFIDGIAGSGAVEAGLISSVATFVVRGILSPFAHPLFTAMIGFGVAGAASAHRRTRQVPVCVSAAHGAGLWPGGVVGYLVPVTRGSPPRPTPSGVCGGRLACSA